MVAVQAGLRQETSDDSPPDIHWWIYVVIKVSEQLKWMWTRVDTAEIMGLEHRK